VDPVARLERVSVALDMCKLASKAWSPMEIIEMDRTRPAPRLLRHTYSVTTILPNWPFFSR
jgi:hypothetical protein